MFPYIAELKGDKTVTSLLLLLTLSTKRVALSGMSFFCHQCNTTWSPFQVVRGRETRSVVIIWGSGIRSGGAHCDDSTATWLWKPVGWQKGQFSMRSILFQTGLLVSTTIRQPALVVIMSSLSTMFDVHSGVVGLFYRSWFPVVAMCVCHLLRSDLTFMYHLIKQSLGNEATGAENQHGGLYVWLMTIT